MRKKSFEIDTVAPRCKLGWSRYLYAMLGGAKRVECTLYTPCSPLEQWICHKFTFCTPFIAIPLRILFPHSHLVLQWERKCGFHSYFISQNPLSGVDYIKNNRNSRAYVLFDVCMAMPQMTRKTHTAGRIWTALIVSNRSWDLGTEQVRQIFFSFSLPWLIMIIFAHKLLG